MKKITLLLLAACCGLLAPAAAEAHIRVPGDPYNSSTTLSLSHAAILATPLVGGLDGADDMGDLHSVALGLWVTHERLLDERLSLAGLLGAGFALVERQDYDEIDLTGTPVVEAGASARYYLLGSFEHGLQAGGQTTYTHSSFGGGGLSGANQGLRLGAFLGYKVASEGGFTFEAQGGAQYFLPLTGDIEDQSGEEGRGVVISGTQASLSPLVQVGLGWSF